MRLLYFKIEEYLCEHGTIGRLIVSLIRSIAYGKYIWITVDKDGDYINAQKEIILYSPKSERTVYKKIRDLTEDYWCVQYLPKTGDVVLDIGAGIGTNTVIFDKLVGHSGAVYAFEANPNTARCLQKTIHGSKCHSTKVLQVAVSDTCGSLLINDSEDHLSNSIFFGEKSKAALVPSITLDKFVCEQNIQQIDLLKINIEGAERQALAGFRQHFDKVQNVAIACHDWISDSGERRIQNKRICIKFSERIQLYNYY